LLDAAGLAVHAATADRPWHMPLMDALPAALRSDGASFVTLHVDGALRGCLGTLEPRRPLLIDVSANAFAACRQDLRFSPIRRADLDGLTLEISVLSALRPFDCADEAELLRRLRPGRDGLVLQDGTRRSTFLPKVWDTLPEPAEFVRQLRCKAGLPAEHWSASQRFWRYGSITVAGRLCEPA
jgi:AmmeMemoRadiSam system protein A